MCLALRSMENNKEFHVAKVLRYEYDRGCDMIMCCATVGRHDAMSGGYRFSISTKWTTI